MTAALFTGCGHEHVRAKATCTELKICDECGKAKGVPLGHTPLEADYWTPSRCAVCGKEPPEMKNILICPIAAILHEISGSSAFYILCSSNLISQKLSKNAISLQFYDTENILNPRALQPCQAKAIIDYFQRIPDGADVFICCDSGESRSPAVAAALMRFQGQSDMEIWDCPDYHPNIYVYKMVCEYAGIRLSNTELRILRARNESAFHTRHS